MCMPSRPPTVCSGNYIVWANVRNMHICNPIFSVSHTHTCTDLLTPVAFPDEPKCNLPVIQRHACAALVIYFLINRCLDDNMILGFLCQHHCINTFKCSQKLWFSPQSTLLVVENDNTFFQPIFENFYIFLMNVKVEKGVAITQHLYSAWIRFFFVICQKLVKHFYMNAIFVHKDHKNLATWDLFVVFLCNEDKTMEFLKASLMIPLFTNLQRMENNWHLAPQDSAFLKTKSRWCLFWPYCEDLLWLFCTNRVLSSMATWWAEATQGTSTWTATSLTSMGSCTITRRPTDATTTCPCRTTGNSRSVSTAGRSRTSPPPSMCKVRVCAGWGKGWRGRRMSTFLTLVRVCAQCLNVGLNSEPL